MFCKYCGSQIPDNSKFCPNCGAQFSGALGRPSQISNVQQPVVNYEPPTQGKNSVLGILSLIFSIIGCTCFVGIILAIIDLCKKDGRKKILSKAGLIIGIVWIVLALILGDSGSDSSKSTTSVETKSQTTSEISEEIKKEENEKEESIGSYDKKPSFVEKEAEVSSEAKRVRVGEVFGNNTISGVVIEADLDYKNYNEMWTQIEEGKKAVFVRIKVTNTSDTENYVSVGDFKCYADNVIVSAELISGGSEDYNANIAAGRSAVLGALYIVPTDTKSLELEYKPIGERAERQIIIIQDENTTETHFKMETPITDASSSKSDVNIIGVGEEFGNRTISGVVTDVDLNFQNFNDLWTQIEAGKKAIYIKIKVTNISNESNYVSVGDFKCYVDDIVTSSELISGTSDDYNANIDPGRSAILGALYVIPANAESIELEYNPLGETTERVIIKIK